MPVFFIKMHISCAGDIQAGMSQKDSELQLKFYRKNKINLKWAKYFFEVSLSRLKKNPAVKSLYITEISLYCKRLPVTWKLGLFFKHSK